MDWFWFGVTKRMASVVRTQNNKNEQLKAMMESETERLQKETLASLQRGNQELSEARETGAKTYKWGHLFFWSKNIPGISETISESTFLV